LQPTGERLNQPGGLAERLQRMRKAAGLTGEQLAAQAGWPRTKISKLENGRQLPTDADVTAWAQACGRDGDLPALLDLLSEALAVHRQFRHRVGRGHAAIQQELDRLVREAKLIRNVEVTIIPGLLQTAGYARYRLQESVRSHGFAADQVEATVAARMRRQDVLYERGREFEFIITEAALRLLPCPPQVMLGQVDRLGSLSGLAHITLGIIPFGVELAVAPMLAFMVLDDMTYIETHASEDLLGGQESAAYSTTADGLMAEAVTGDEALRLLAAAAGMLRG
jgi:transcriptional regulator with XRE-family HTH domain